MAQLKEEWITQIKGAIEILEKFHNQKVDRSVDVIVDTMISSLGHIEKRRLRDKNASTTEIEEIKRKYRDKIIKKEKSAEKLT